MEAEVESKGISDYGAKVALLLTPYFLLAIGAILDWITTAIAIDLYGEAGRLIREAHPWSNPLYAFLTGVILILLLDLRGLIIPSLRFTPKDKRRARIIYTAVEVGRFAVAASIYVGPINNIWLVYALRLSSF